VKTNLATKVIWITGASSGIGAALAMKLRGAGARLILSARRVELLEEVRRRCGSEGVALLPLDLARADTLQEKVSAARAVYGTIDVLVNNAGITQRAAAVETKLSTVRTIMETNFFGTVSLTTEVVRSMIEEKKPGQVVVVTSLVGKFGAPLRSTYSASKHALHGYFDALRAEVAGHGIGVLLVVPGFIRTELSRTALRADGSYYGISDTALERGMSPDLAADRIVAALCAGKEEVTVGLDARTWLALKLKRFAPGLLSRMLRTAKVT
jgi:short-subunit dehydrogenase